MSSIRTDANPINRAMALDDPAYLEVLRDNYDSARAQADALRKQDQPERAAQKYEESAEMAGKIAEAESDRSLANSWRDLAEKLERAARQLREEGSLAEPDTQRDIDPGETSDGLEQAEDVFVTERPDIDFVDVGGMGELKQELLDKVRNPIERRELYETYGIGVANAIMLYGPPGTGKTHITRALAGELDFTFVQAMADDIVSKYVGEAAENVSRLFEVARENQPSLVFLDEIDAISQRRAGETQQTQSQVQMVNQLLAEITDIKGADVVLIGATNRPDIIDDALLDRFEELIEVPLPDPQGRVAIFRVHLRDRPMLSDRIDWGRIRELTEGFSARDIETAVDNAALAALTEAREQGEIQPITQSHLEAAIRDVEPIESNYGQF